MLPAFACYGCVEARLDDLGDQWKAIPSGPGQMQVELGVRSTHGFSPFIILVLVEPNYFILSLFGGIAAAVKTAATIAKSALRLSSGQAFGDFCGLQQLCCWPSAEPMESKGAFAISMMRADLAEVAALAVFIRRDAYTRCILRRLIPIVIMNLWLIR